MNTAVAINPGQVWREYEHARRLEEAELDPAGADVEVLRVDWVGNKAQVQLPGGGTSWRKIRRITERCELLPPPQTVIEYRGLGGSQAAAVVGEHPYVPLIELWGQLVGELPAFEGNEKTKWGKLHEPTIRNDYSEHHGCTVLVPREPYYHPARPWVRASPDGVVPDRARGLEIKCVGVHSADRWGPSGGDAGDVPQEHVIQCTWYMWVYDYEEWDVAALIGGNDYREYTIERDLELEAVVVEMCSDFWHNNVLNKIPPELDGSTAYSEYIERHNKYARDVYLPATTDTTELALQLREAKTQAKELEETEGLIKNHLRLAIGEAAGVQTPAGPVICKPRRGRPDYKPVAEQLAGLVGMSDADFRQLVDDNRRADTRPVMLPRKKKTK